ncbi:MAG TPA: hypothetical protein VIJ82_07265 [Streptosporangiaceae bacterium]
MRLLRSSRDSAAWLTWPAPPAPQHPGLAGHLAAASGPELERQTLAYMATMLAWRDDPRLVARREG